MHRAALALVAGLLLVACDNPLDTDGSGGIWLNIDGEISAVDGARVRIVGPAGNNSTVQTRQLTETADAFIDTIVGLAPGRYDVALEGLNGADVELYGKATGVTVEGGKNATANVTVGSFQSSITGLQNLTSAVGFQVTFGSVSGAESYLLQWSSSPTFASAQQTTVSPTQGTSVTVNVPGSGMRYVRIRAVNEYGGNGQWSAAQTVDVIAPLASITVSPDNQWLIEARQLQLSAELRDPNGNVLTDRAIAWSSSMDAVATVDTAGLVDGVSGGTVTIVASSEGLADTVTVNVATPIPLANGDLVGGSLAGAGEIDFFTINATAGDEVLLTLVQTAGFGGSTRARAELLDPAGAPVTTFDANNQQRLTLATTGEYVVQVRANNGVATGSYNIGLEGLQALAPDSVAVTLGDLTSGALNLAGEVDMFTFDGVAADVVVLTLVQTSGFGGSTRARMEVFGPSGTTVGTAMDANGQQRLTLAESGRYVVRVQANTLTATGGYALGLEGLTPLSPDTVTIALADLITGSLGAAGEVDLFTFTGTQGDNVFLTIVQTSGFGGSTHPRIQLFDPAGTPVGTFLDANNQQTVTLPGTGRYVVRVEANSLTATGGYALGMEGLTPLSPDTVTIALGDLISGSLSAAGEMDLFTFMGTQGDNVFLTIVQTSGFGGSTHPRIQLFDPAGNAVGTFLDANNQQNVALPATGRYVVRVEANTLTTTGGYSLGLEGLTPLSPDTVTIALGDLTSGSLGAAGEMDLFTFTGTQGDNVFLTIVQTSGFGGSTHPRIQLFDPAGTTVGASFDANNQQQVALPVTGRYVVRVEANTLTTTGGYSLGLEGLTPLSPDTVTMALGDLTSGSLGAAGEVDLFTFTGTQGDNVFLTIVQTSGFGGSTHPRIQLFDPAGTAVGAFLDANNQQQVALPATGRYVVRVEANTLTTTGGYSLGLEGLTPPSPDSTGMVLGDLLTGSLAALGEIDLFTFTGAQNHQVALTLVQTSGFGGSTHPRLQLFDPAGSPVGTFFDATNRQQVALPMAGRYVVRVEANTLTATGAYSLGLEGIVPVTPGAPALTSGASQAASIVSAGQADLYTVAGQVGDSLVIDLTHTAGFTGSAPAQVTLFSPAGATLGTVNSNGQLIVAVTSAGTHVLQVRALNFVTTGSYQLDLVIN